MDYSAVVIPVTKADKAVDKVDPNHVPLNDVDKLNWEACKHDEWDRTYEARTDQPCS
jgi:amidase